MIEVGRRSVSFDPGKAEIVMSTSKVIDNLDCAARAAGFAMVGSEDSLNQAALPEAPAQVDEKVKPVAKKRQLWLTHAASVKSSWSLGTGWSPWKATA